MPSSATVTSSYLNFLGFRAGSLSLPLPEQILMGPHPILQRAYEALPEQNRTFPPFPRPKPLPRTRTLSVKGSVRGRERKREKRGLER